MCNTSLVVLTVAMLMQTSSTQPKPFASKEGGFTVQFPAKPEYMTATTPTALGDRKFNAFHTTLNNRTLMVGWIVVLDIPEEKEEDLEALNKLMTGENLEKFYTDGRNGELQRLRGKLLGQRAVKLGERPGIEYEFEYPSGDGVSTRHAQTRIFYANDRLYTVKTVGDQEFVESKFAKDFLRSFRLTK